MGQITVFSGPVRRRRWSEEERLQILHEAFLPGACVAEVCRRHDISTALIYTWRRKIREVQADTASDKRRRKAALTWGYLALRGRGALRERNQATQRGGGIA